MFMGLSCGIRDIAILNFVKRVTENKLLEMLIVAFEFEL